MTTGKKVRVALRGPFVISKKRANVSTGEALRFARDFNELSQNDLAELTGLPQSTLSALENDRIQLGAERAKILARALKVHPAVLLFPSWNTERESAA